MSDLLDDLRRLEATATDYGQGRTADAFSRAAAEIARLRAEAAAARLAGWRAGREAGAAWHDEIARRSVTANEPAMATRHRAHAAAIRAIPEPEETDDV